MSRIIILVIMIFMILGGIDKIFGYRLGFGRRFDEGLMTIGPMTIAIAGIISITPLISKALMPVSSMLNDFFHIDPSILTASLLASDMGGYNLSMGLAQSMSVGRFSGTILASTLGTTIIFTIPMAVTIIKKEDYEYFIKGILIGLATIPLGNFIGGVLGGLSPAVIIKNLTPIIILSFALSLALIKKPKPMIKAFSVLGKGVVSISTIGLIISAFQGVTGIIIIRDLIPIREGLLLAGNIGIILSGAYSMFFFISSIIGRHMSKVEKRFGIKDVSVLGIFASMFNNVAMFNMLKDMDKKGKVLNCSFAVSGAFTFGGQLGFISSVEPSMVVPAVTAKLVGGFSSMLIAYKLYDYIAGTNNNGEELAGNYVK